MFLVFLIRLSELLGLGKDGKSSPLEGYDLSQILNFLVEIILKYSMYFIKRHYHVDEIKQKRIQKGTERFKIYLQKSFLTWKILGWQLFLRLYPKGTKK